MHDELGRYGRRLKKHDRLAKQSSTARARLIRTVGSVCSVVGKTRYGY
jgi:hypothetical protein